MTALRRANTGITADSLSLRTVMQLLLVVHHARVWLAHWVMEIRIVGRTPHRFVNTFRALTEVGRWQRTGAIANRHHGGGTRWLPVARTVESGRIRWQWTAFPCRRAGSNGRVAAGFGIGGFGIGGGCFGGGGGPLTAARIRPSESDEGVRAR
jgi:hypothetical protein